MPNEWIQVGARVAVYYLGTNPPTVRFTTVERLTPTQIILVGVHARFNRNTLREIGDTSYGLGGELKELSDPVVRRTYARQLMSTLFTRLDRLDRETRNDNPLAVLALIEAQIAKYRKAILNVTDVEGEE